MVGSILGRTIKQFAPISSRFFYMSAASCVSFKKWYRGLWEPRTNDPPYVHITQIGDPVLRRKAEDVPAEYVTNEHIKVLVDQMVTVLRKYQLVGIAAPQIGIGLRIIAMEFKESVKDNFPAGVYKLRQMSTLPLTVVINPVLKVSNYNKLKFPEGCASVKGYSAEVERYEEVHLSGVNEKGDSVELELKGWNARIAQHEIDHLDGRIYTDIMDASTFNCTCWQAVNAHNGRVEIRFSAK